jgi:hypothetical protein
LRPSQALRIYACAPCRDQVFTNMVHRQYRSITLAGSTNPVILFELLMTAQNLPITHVDLLSHAFFLGAYQYIDKMFYDSLRTMLDMLPKNAADVAAMTQLDHKCIEERYAAIEAKYVPVTTLLKRVRKELVQSPPHVSDLCAIPHVRQKAEELAQLVMRMLGAMESAARDTHCTLEHISTLYNTTRAGRFAYPTLKWRELAAKTSGLPPTHLVTGCRAFQAIEAVERLVENYRVAVDEATMLSPICEQPSAAGRIQVYSCVCQHLTA